MIVFFPMCSLFEGSLSLVLVWWYVTANALVSLFAALLLVV
jgi:hypothetical protein